jgi:hypothetical protein
VTGAAGPAAVYQRCTRPERRALRRSVHSAGSCRENVKRPPAPRVQVHRSASRAGITGAPPRVLPVMRSARRWLVAMALLAAAALASFDPPRPARPAPSRVLVRDETEALARVIRSEAGAGTEAERVSVGWAARNRARKLGISVARMVCDPWCGPQHEQDATMRPMSSDQEPTPADRLLAARILVGPRSADPTRGADSFIEPALQDQLVAQGRLGYRRTYAAWRKRWLRAGQTRLRRVGRFELWRALGKPGASREPCAEHSWHLALCVLLLAEHGGPTASPTRRWWSETRPSPTARRRCEAT